MPGGRRWRTHQSREELHVGIKGDARRCAVVRDEVVLDLGRVLSVTVEYHRLYEHDERGR